MESARNRVYFISDAHLGTPDHHSSLERERKLVRFLESIRKQASDLYILGDLFDFWFEYKHVVPRGHTRILGKLSEMADEGIRIHYFCGNHDLWIFNYLHEEIGMTLYRNPTGLTLGSSHFLLAHGDGMDEGDIKFRILRRIFSNRFLQWSFARIHPNLAFEIARGWSRRSRMIHGVDPFKGEEEPLIRFARKHYQEEGCDYIILGHRHINLDYPLTDHTRVIILGDWMSLFTYAEFDGETVLLKQFSE